MNLFCKIFGHKWFKDLNNESEIHKTCTRCLKTIYKKEFDINSDEVFKMTGYYSVIGHVNPDEDKNCFVTQIEKSGMVNCKGMKAFRGGGCGHRLKFKFLRAYS